MAEQIRYRRGTASAEELQEEVIAFWRALRENGGLRREAEEVGLNPEVVEKLDLDRDIQVRQEGEGFDPLTVTIIVAFAPAGVHALNSLWDEVALPWIRRRRGSDALGDEKERR